MLYACSTTHLFVILYLFLPSSQPSPDGEPLLTCSAVLDFFFHSSSRRQIVGFVPCTQSCWISFFCSSSRHQMVSLCPHAQPCWVSFLLSPSCCQMVSVCSRAQPYWTSFLLSPSRCQMVSHCLRAQPCWISFLLSHCHQCPARLCSGGRDSGGSPSQGIGIILVGETGLRQCYS